MSESGAHFEKKGAGARDGVFLGPHRNGSKDTVQGGQILTRPPSTLKAFCRGKNKAADFLEEITKSQDKHLMTTVTPPHLLTLQRRLDKVRQVMGTG